MVLQKRHSVEPHFMPPSIVAVCDLLLLRVGWSWQDKCAHGGVTELRRPEVFECSPQLASSQATCSTSTIAEDIPEFVL